MLGLVHDLTVTAYARLVEPVRGRDWAAHRALLQPGVLSCGNKGPQVVLAEGVRSRDDARRQLVQVWFGQHVGIEAVGVDSDLQVSCGHGGLLGVSLD
jgi:hypothetical protein